MVMHGARCAMTTGMNTTHKWSAISLDLAHTPHSLPILPLQGPSMHLELTMVPIS